jgi:hypothetical protein
MATRLSGRSGCAVVVLVLFVPAILTAYFLHSAIWLIVIPVGIIILAMFAAAYPFKRKVTPKQFADELERHLLGRGDRLIGTIQRQSPSPTNGWNESVGNFRSSIL